MRLKPLILLFSCLAASQAHAFYAQEFDEAYLEARGLLYVAGSQINDEQINGISTRLMLDADVSAWHIEYQQVWQQTYATTNTYNTEADRLNISYTGESTQIKLGRQALNLTTTFFFSPNDFFAPFTVQSLNRDYKQGVDALYIEQQTGALSQVALIAVNSHDESLPTSSIAKFDSVWGDISWAVLAGEIHSLNPLGGDDTTHIIGGHLQTDIGNNLALRLEGHNSRNNGNHDAEWVLGLEQRINADLMISGEYFYHGAAKPLPHLPYSGKHLFAFGANYQFTPLLMAQFSMIRQLDDQSMLTTVYINYSLSDESTLNLSILMPSGSASSEFQQYPDVFALDYQLYF